MTAREQGFLLLTSHLGDPERKVLTDAQFRALAQSVRRMTPWPNADRELTARDLYCLGLRPGLAERIAALLNDQPLLEYYVKRARRMGCEPMTRISPAYPRRLRQRLQFNAPGCLWYKGAPGALEKPCVSLVGSRELREPNREFAHQVGLEAAKQGFALVSGNARGADREGQQACRQAGGDVICVVADELEKQPSDDGVFYLSEDDYNAPFSPQRALSRNRIIHALGAITFVAQCGLETGGTWAGTLRNLRAGWSPVFCFDDGSPAAARLAQEGAILIRTEALRNLPALLNKRTNFFTW